MRTAGHLAAAIAAALVLATLPAGAQAGVTQAEARAWKPDVAAAKSYADRRSGLVSFSVMDMRGRFQSIRGHHRVAMASTFKVMLMVAYLRRPSVRDRALTSGEKALLKPMIRRSDNIAATRIRDTLGRGPIDELARDANMKRFAWNDIWGYCRTSARDQAQFMRHLRRYVPKRHWLFARRQLQSIVGWQRWGVAKVKPEGWDLLFKGGWGSGSGAVDHQVALLQNGSRRIGVAVMTEANPNHDYAKATLQGVFHRLLSGLPR